MLAAEEPVLALELRRQRVGQAAHDFSAMREVHVDMVAYAADLRHSRAEVGEGKRVFVQPGQKVQREEQAVEAHMVLEGGDLRERPCPRGQIAGGEHDLQPQTSSERVERAGCVRRSVQRGFAVLRHCPAGEQLHLRVGQQAVLIREYGFFTARGKVDADFVCAELHQLLLPFHARGEARVLEGVVGQIQKLLALRVHGGAQAADMAEGGALQEAEIAEIAAPDVGNRPRDAGIGARHVLPVQRVLDFALFRRGQGRAVSVQRGHGVALSVDGRVQTHEGEHVAQLRQRAFADGVHLRALRTEAGGQRARLRSGYAGCGAADQHVSGLLPPHDGASGANGVLRRDGADGCAHERACQPLSPDQVFEHDRAVRHALARPHAHAGLHAAARADARILADHAFLKCLRAVQHLRAWREHAGAQLAVAPGEAAGIEHGALDAGVFGHDGARADDASGQHLRSCADPRARAEKHGGFKDSFLVYNRARHAHNAALRHVDQRNAPFQRVAVGFQIGGNITNVAPVGLRQVAVHRHALAEQKREQLAPEVKRLIVRNSIQNLRLEDVDAGVRRVGGDVLPVRLLGEGHDATVRVRAHKTVAGRVLHALQNQRRLRAVRAVERERFGQVHVGQPVAGKHAEGFGQKRARGLDAARRAHRARFAKIFERNAVFAAVAERVLNLVGQVAERNSGAFHAVTREQAQGIGENRLIEHQRHRFRKRTGERAQTFALAARHDHRKHRKNLP